MQLTSTTARIAFCIMLLFAFCCAPQAHCAEKNVCSIQHPLNPPDMTLKGMCPNCGMGRPMWARTWFSFDAHEGQSQACSLHCLADLNLKTGSLPKNIKVALYMAPEKNITADKAFFVLGSSAKGTMTMKSKPAFASKAEAQAFATSYGGEVVDFAKALEVAKQGVAKENVMISKKRIKMGKIAEPVDGKDQCPVCAMYPARYAKNKCQLTTKDNHKYHFCSTQCLFSFLKDSAKYEKTASPIAMIWVVDYESGNWISAYTAYYVVGSGVQGPMGHEAFAFDSLAAAKAFVKKEGGKIQRFDEVTPNTIKTLK